MVNEKVYARLSAYAEDEIIMKRKKKKDRESTLWGAPPHEIKYLSRPRRGASFYVR